MLGVSVGLSPWRKEALRTTLWVVPLVLLAGAVVLFLVTYDADSRVYRHGTVVPSWVRIESADGARQLLGALAAAVITVLGVVFSVTIVALTLASQQFGPHAAELHPGLRDPGDIGQFRRDVRLCGAHPRCDRRRDPSHNTDGQDIFQYRNW